MNHKNAKARVRAEALEEAKQDEEQEARIELRLRKWKLGSILLGGTLIASIVAIVPFLAGHPLHNRWDSAGRRILQLSMGLFLAFMYVAGTALTFWYYLRETKKIHKRFAPPGSKYRMGKSGLGADETMK